MVVSDNLGAGNDGRPYSQKVIVACLFVGSEKDQAGARHSRQRSSSTAVGCVGDLQLQPVQQQQQVSQKVRVLVAVTRSIL